MAGFKQGLQNLTKETENLLKSLDEVLGRTQGSIGGKFGFPDQSGFVNTPLDQNPQLQSRRIGL